MNGAVVSPSVDRREARETPQPLQRTNILSLDSDDPLEVTATPPRSG
jgi:hypothetical protein